MTVGVVADQLWRAFMEGRRMDKEGANSLEAGLAVHPDEIEVRSRLIGFYFDRSSSDPLARDSRVRHLIWLRTVWLPGVDVSLWSELEVESVAEVCTILESGVDAFEKGLGILLLEAATQFTDSPTWPDRLSAILIQRGSSLSGSARVRTYLAASQILQRILEEIAELPAVSAIFLPERYSEGSCTAGDLDPSLIGRAYLALDRLVICSLDIEDSEQLRSSSEALLRLARLDAATPFTSRALHLGHTGLGVLDLQEQRLGEAVSHLSMSIPKGSGPIVGDLSFVLAGKLVAAGIVAPVIAFLQDAEAVCARPYPFERWRRMIWRGVIPPFDDNA